MSNFREQSEWTAQQALAYITGLQAVDQQSEYEAFATAYNYFMNLSRKKISWSVHLQKLAYEFIDLAFDNNKHSSIKDVLKAYRSITQGQYSQSLKDVLQHYRDRKLQAILQQDILHQNIDLITQLPNIQNEQASSTVIFSSFKPSQKKKLQELKHKLKIVWDGYKYIIETVRINQKLEDVFKSTLTKIFAFVDRFNRKHELKSFCRTLRSSLMNAFSKRDKSEQQKAIYIDIEKSDVNDRNIDIRLEQFKVTIKLGLWQQAFQVLEDINNLMKVRKGIVMGKIMYKYYDNLALLFKKSNYWHYHAFAYYNFYLVALKNPKLSAKQRVLLSDTLLLSILCIPPVTLQSNQSKQSQLKISSMMVSSTKIPKKEELFEIVVGAGIAEKASVGIRNLWEFMGVEFDLESLRKGLALLNQIKDQAYEEFKVLIEDILIHKQLQSISETYQRIKIDSLLNLIPLPRSRIQKILLSSYHQKILDFVLDEDQKIIIFEDKSSQKFSNPTQTLLSVSTNLFIQTQLHRPSDQAFILRKLCTFIETSEQYYWKIRTHKIQEFRKKLKKPKQEMLNEVHRRKMMEKEERQRQQNQKLLKEQQLQRENQQKKKIFGTKKIIINDIRDIKQNRVVRILGKKIQDLTDQQIQNISIDTLNTHLEQIKTKIQNNKQARFKKAFNQVDYIQRERRQRLDGHIKSLIPSAQAQSLSFKQIHEQSLSSFTQKSLLKSQISKLMSYLKPKIQEETKKIEQAYDSDLKEYKQRLNDFYREKIVSRAKALAEENRRKKEADEKLMREYQSQYSTAKWTFRSNKVVDAVETTAGSFGMGGITMGKKMGDTTTAPSTNNYDKPQQKFNNGQAPKFQMGISMGSKKVEQKQPTKQYKPYNNQQPKKLAFGVAKKQPQPVPVSVQQPSHSFVPPVTQKKTMGMGNFAGSFNKPAEKKTEQPKKDGKPRAPGKGYVNVN